MKPHSASNYATHRFRALVYCLGACSILIVLLFKVPSASGHAAFRKLKGALPLGEILASMNERARGLKTVSANIEYTKVTVVVNDKSTEYGELYFRNEKTTEILLKFQKPDPKVIHFYRNKAEIYLPKSNQIQEYDLEKQSGLVEQFLLLGFGKETGNLEKVYGIKLIGEEDLSGDTAAVLELSPRKENIAAQLTKVQLWISEESWIPVQQKFFEAGGDYLITRYTNVKTNRQLPSSAFQIPHSGDAKRVKMN